MSTSQLGGDWRRRRKVDLGDVPVTRGSVASVKHKAGGAAGVHKAKMEGGVWWEVRLERQTVEKLRKP